MSEQDENKAKTEWAVVGYNVLALCCYTLLLRFVSGGIIFDCILVGIHFLIGIIMAIIRKKWEWTLAAFLVLIIGFSTCVMFLGNTLNLH
jgi:hypothetical protein